MTPLLLASTAFSIGGLFMKPSLGFTRTIPSMAVVLCFALGAIFLTIAVQHGSLSTTYVMGLGLETLVAVAIGRLVLGESISMAQAGGIALVVIGMVLLRA